MISKKKIFLAATLLANILGTTVPVVAENNPTDSTNIGYVVSQQYEWNIPSSIAFDANSNTNTKQLTVSVSKNIIESQKLLHIALSPDSTFTISDVDSPSNKRTYIVSSGNTVYTKGQDVLSIPSGVNIGSNTLTLTLQSVPVQKAGTYKGTINFVSSVS